MKFFTPEISWHNRDPIYSVDLQHLVNGMQRLATCGGDKHIRIWSLAKKVKDATNVEFLSTLSRHQKTVNVVRFSPDGQILASGGDDSFVILWKLGDSTGLPSFDEEEENKETWNVFKIFRNHLDDVYDLSWSSDGQRLVSGSGDNTAILWDVGKGCKLWMFTDHKHFVQGVSHDPFEKYIITMSCDRSMRVYQLTNNLMVFDVKKLPVTSKPTRMFHDDSMKSFFRRLSFSPDGNLLVVPSGCMETDTCSDSISTTYIFSRDNLSKPVAHLPLPSPCKMSIAVRFCPKLFKLWKDHRMNSLATSLEVSETLFQIPYRMIFAVITDNSIILYDTQLTTPLAYISNIHYHTLSDLTWSESGLLLVVSSTDGYCTVINFEDGELGEIYEPEEMLLNVKLCKDGEKISNQTESSVAIAQIATEEVMKESSSNKCPFKQSRRITVTTLFVN